jgi:hypothetical protein
MTSHNFMIGPIKDGLRKDLRPYAIPEDAFEVMTNAYQWRGRVVRRPGYSLVGNLANGTPVMGLRTRELFGLGLQELIAFDTTQAYHLSGGVFVVLPSVMPVTWNGTDYQFFYTTNYAGGFWATNSVPGYNGWAVTLFAAAAGTGTSATVNVTATGNTAVVGDSVYFLNIQGAAAANNLIFATVTAIDVGGNPAVITVQATSFPKGINSFTNGIATGFILDSTQQVAGQDGIRYYAETAIGNTWVNYNPPIDTVNALMGALLIFPYRGYLVFLNTTEGNSPSTPTNFPNRARWTQYGTPYYSAPAPNFPSTQTVDPLAARDDLFGRGGAIDAPTSEAIISAAFIRDLLVVKFERSTWRLRFVNNAQNPFVWERVNIELGSSCTFSTIAFDKGAVDIGNRGINISDGNDTVRFDEKIPDDIFKIRQNNQGLQRVYGIRTFESKLLYWTYPSDLNPAGIYPEMVLVYNYETKNWSYFDDTFTCFGYFYPAQNNFITWNDLTEPWASYGNLTWDAGSFQGGFETIVAGNQQGFVFALESDVMVNCPSLNISAISGSTITSTNHNLADGTWIKITGVTGTLTLADGTSINGRNFRIANASLNPNTFTIQEYQPIEAGNASGTLFIFQIAFVPVIAGSVQINVGTLVFTDALLNGDLYVSGVPSGTIDYNTGTIVLNFATPISSTPVSIRVVSYSPEQLIDPAATTGIYSGGGQITKISNIDIQTKVFNFFNDDKRSRLSKIDFYVESTENGQFTCNVFSDDSDLPANNPLPDNLQSNVVVTRVNPYQIGVGDQTIYRLFADVIAQTVQLQFTLSDRQMAVDAINASDIEITALMITMRRGGRLV